ncbi:hypothetical protein HHI36_011800 [Cryptolaemus montrouzieri]|uniref:HTH psq-type domain-containing protein n=1 Tax=Cryptolaemus montrouzieri TaxID=559131 RepID=A0ABD2NE02_9CUCU
MRRVKNAEAEPAQSALCHCQRIITRHRSRQIRHPLAVAWEQPNVPRQKCQNLTNTRRERWEKEEMAATIAAVREKEVGYTKATKLFNVPTRSTLFRFVTDRDSPIEAITNNLTGRRPVVGQEK